MRRSFLVTLFILVIATIYGQSQPITENFKKLDWLEGTWNRTNVKPGRSEHERWIKLSANEWQGFGVVMKGEDTVFLEKLKLVIKEENIYYAADVPGNKEIIYFKFIEITDTGFACENPRHDFPKKIAYQKDGDKIKAIISGDGKSIEYWFEKR